MLGYEVGQWCRWHKRSPNELGQCLGMSWPRKLRLDLRGDAASSTGGDEKHAESPISTALLGILLPPGQGLDMAF